MKESDFPAKWARVISKLIELTQHGKLVWQPVEAETVSDNGIHSAFQTHYKDRPLRIYKRNRTMSLPQAVLDVTTFPAPDRTEVILELGSPDGKAWWRFPETSALSDLLEAVQFQQAGVFEFLDDILNETG